jgi:hypothetical protein
VCLRCCSCLVTFCSCSCLQFHCNSLPLAAHTPPSAMSTLAQALLMRTHKSDTLDMCAPHAYQVRRMHANAPAKRLHFCTDSIHRLVLSL